MATAEGREELKMSMKSWRDRNKEKANGYSKKTRDNLRLAILNKFNNKCVKCNFNDPRALQVDHINGGGRKELINKFGLKEGFRSGGVNIFKYYKHVLKDQQNKYQLLCANCNAIKKIQNKEYGKISNIQKTYAGV
jgi:hypothetical protein